MSLISAGSISLDSTFKVNSVDTSVEKKPCCNSDDDKLWIDAVEDGFELIMIQFDRLITILISRKIPFQITEIDMLTLRLERETEEMLLLTKAEL
jgi:hypothetical protein